MTEQTLREKLEAHIQRAGAIYDYNTDELLKVIREHAAGVARDFANWRAGGSSCQERIVEALEKME